MIYLFAKNSKAYAKLFDDDPGERERVENCGAFDESEFDRTLYTFNGDVDEFESFHKGLQWVDIKITDDFYNAVYDSLDYGDIESVDDERLSFMWQVAVKASRSEHLSELRDEYAKRTKAAGAKRDAERKAKYCDKTDLPCWLCPQFNKCDCENRRRKDKSETLQCGKTLVRGMIPSKWLNFGKG